MRWPRLRRPLLAAAAVGVLAGCGSTVQGLGNNTPATGNQGLGIPSGTSTVGSNGAVPGVVPGASAPGVAAPGVAATGSGTGTQFTGGSTSGQPTTTHLVNGVPQGVGVTATKIYVGISYETNGDAANAAFGATGISQGDPQADAKAVIADINTHGGIAGRQVVPVFHAINAASTDTYADMDQQTCAAYTQDNHVFAAMDKGLTDNFPACMQHAGAMNFNSGTILYPDQALLQQYSYYFDAGTLTTDRVFQQLPRSLANLGYYNGWDANLGRASSTSATKIGVLTYDNPEWTRPLNRLLSGLASNGHPVSPGDVIKVQWAKSTADTRNLASAVSSAELKFREDGVNHVVLLDASGLQLLFFSRAAQGQHYYPRYGLDSGSGMQTLESGGDVDPQQLNGAVGFGWSPDIDLTPSAAAKYEPARMKACLQMIDKRTGQKLESEPNAAGIAISYCEVLYLLKWGAEHAGTSITRDTVRAALEHAQSSYPPVGFLQEYYGPGRHDGVQVGWNFAWDTGCTCTKYVGNSFQIPSL
jgi:hypothetical protein